MEKNINFDTTLGDFVASYPKTRKVFENFGLDYCCGGKQDLKKAAEAKNVDINALLEELEETINKGIEEDSEEIKIWKDESIKNIINHIVSKHHTYMRSELPRIDTLLNKIVQVHGPKHGDFLNSLSATYKLLKEALEEHLNDEEMILFPFAKELEAGANEADKSKNTGSDYKEIVEILYTEHEDAGEALAKMRNITSNYVLPTDACASFESLYESLEALEDDLHEHVHLENMVLFPKIEKLMGEKE